MVKTAVQSGTKLEIDSGLAIMYATDVFTALKEKSTKVVNLWNVNGSSPFTAFCAEDLQVDCLQGGNGPCVEQSKEFVGLLATNALIFNRNPPRLIDDEIQFLLASPHLLPDSKATVGNFNLEASSSMLRCIYGLPDLPLFGLYNSLMFIQLLLIVLVQPLNLSHFNQFRKIRYDHFIILRFSVFNFLFGRF